MIDFTATLDRLEMLAEHVPWPQISKTRFFHWVTTTTTADPLAASSFLHFLYPRHHLYTVSTSVYSSVFLASVMGLHGLLLVHTRPSFRSVFRPNIVLRRTNVNNSRRLLPPAAGIPLSTRTKQWLAFPMWCILVGWPLWVSCESTLLQLGVALFAAWIGQRTLDVYFIQPWSGVAEMRQTSYRDYTAFMKAVGSKAQEKERGKKGLESIEGHPASDSEREHGILRRSVRLQLVRAKRSSSSSSSPTSSSSFTSDAITAAATDEAAAAIAPMSCATPGESKFMTREKGGLALDPTHQTPEQSRGDQRMKASAMVLNWDWDRLMIELWLPMRKFSRPTPSSSSSSSSMQSSTSSPSSPLRWKQQSGSPSSTRSQRFIIGSHLVWTVIVYRFLIDWLVYKLSFVPLDWVQSSGSVRYGIFVTLSGALIMLMTLWPVRLAAWIYHRRYGHLPGHQTLDVEEWTMLGNPLPCFATTPVEFWLHWHTTLRYIWVDLGFLPMRKVCREVLTKERVGRTVSKVAEEVLPVMAVFTLSGLLHAYVVMAVWRESGWSQMAYFWIQGAAVVLTKGLERTKVGRWIRLARQDKAEGVGGIKAKARRMVLDGVGWTLMILVWHVATVPLFVEPYLKSGMWLETRELSLVWWIMTKVTP